MAIDSQHPDYAAVIEDYRVMRDTFAGERTVKGKTIAYLPPTSGQLADGATKNFSSTGALAYLNYLSRAKFSDLVKDAVNTLVGVMVREPAVIELPPQLEPMRESATRKNETLQMLIRRIYEQQILFGRYGLLGDFPQDPASVQAREVPHLVEYSSESIINWDDERFSEFGVNRLNFVVMNETAQVRGNSSDQFEWTEQKRYRVVILEPLDPEQEPSLANRYV